jgi:hypothetical protein
VFRHFTDKHLFRCHECGWRGWGDWKVDESRTVPIADEQIPNLTVIDEHLEHPDTVFEGAKRGEGAVRRRQPAVKASKPTKRSPRLKK